MKKNKHLDNRGVATIFSVIVATVLMVFCLALLLVSYTLYVSASKAQNRSRSRALTVSLSEELRDSITSVSFETYEEEQTARENGEDQLWFYLRDNLDGENWIRYQKENDAALHDSADKVFNIETDDVIDGIGANLTVTMYWMYGTEDVADGELSDTEQEEAADEGLNEKSNEDSIPDSISDSGETENEAVVDKDIYLYVQVETIMGDQTYSLTTVYDLEAESQYEDNPGRYKWKWQYDGRGEPTDE
jgi:hypothetical protein